MGKSNMAIALGQTGAHTCKRGSTLNNGFMLWLDSRAHSNLFFFSLSLLSIVSCNSKKVESEGGASAAKKDSKRKREFSVNDDAEVKSPPPSPPEEEDDDGVQV